MAKDKKIKVELEKKEQINSKNKSVFSEGIRTEKDLIAPAAIKVIDPKTLLVGDYYVRNFAMQGYPNNTYIGWLNNLYKYRGSLDVMVRFEPMDTRAAIEQLTKQIAAVQSQLITEQDKGSISNITRYQAQVDKLMQQRAMLEQNLTNLLQCYISANLLDKTEESLNKASDILQDTIKGQRMLLMPTELQMLQGFQSALPCLSSPLKGKLRNFDTAAAVGCFPFYDDELSDPDGVFLGFNYSTGTPAYINFLGKEDKVENQNISVFGRAGSGKSYFVKLLILRSCLKGVHTAIIDPEGEYGDIAKNLGGVTIKIGDGTSSNINMFDIDEEAEVDDNGNYTGRSIVNIKEKVSDILGIIGVMCKELTPVQESVISEVILKLYNRFGITTDPRSLYVGGQLFDNSNASTNLMGRRKKMPTFSDFYNLLKEEQIIDPSVESLVRQLQMFKKGGVYDMFDCQSNIDLSDLKNIPVLNFDVKALDSGGETLRPIGMYIASTLIWDKFVKKMPGVKKRVIVDEAWMMLNKNMSGHKYTSKFLETLARRIRKRHAGLLTASQNFSEFLESSEGQVVVKNSPYIVFLRQSETDLQSLSDTFQLTEGERNFVTRSEIGQILLKTDRGSSIIRTYSFPFEHKILTAKTF